MVPLEVQGTVGKPNTVEEATIPSGSAVGLQDCFVYKMAPADPYLEWLFRRGDRHFLVFFAHDNIADEWKLSWKVSYPSVVDDL
jgi:hypothetical protein